MRNRSGKICLWKSPEAKRKYIFDVSVWRVVVVVVAYSFKLTFCLPYFSFSLHSLLNFIAKFRLDTIVGSLCRFHFQAEWNYV